MILDDRQRHTMYAALRCWLLACDSNPVHVRDLKALATNGGKLKEMTNREVETLLGALVHAESESKPAKASNALKVKDWLQKENFNTTDIHTVQDILDQAGNMLDGAEACEITGTPVFMLEDDEWYYGHLEFCIDPASPELVVELKSCTAAPD
jgi:hypothetical protein